MNLAEALLAALPELPTQVIANKNYKLNPDLIVREELDENQEPIVVIYIPEKAWMLRVPPSQYKLLQLFNGERSFAEIAQLHMEQTGEELTEKEVRDFVTGSVETGFWHQSQRERNITLSQKLSEERRKRIKKKSKFADLSHIVFQGFNPDGWLTALDQWLWWIYTPWFTAFTLCLFGYMTWVWIDRWAEIGNDTVLYYTFTQKSGWDLLEFWLLFLVMAFFHETAHGLTCKHYGARVPNMGFQLIYLAPAFATEITEIWVRAGRRERLLAILAGIWMEGILCAIATVVWVLTPQGAFWHEWAYKVMLITGLITLIVNLNPLIKLDGYYMLAELVGISELKERSTGFVAGWVKKHIFRLPVDLEYVPFRRRFLYVPYALLSGVYSYLLLFAISRFTYNVLSKWFAEWAIIPAALVAWKIFKGRLFRLVAFMKTVFQDKREHIVRALTPARVAVGAVALAILLFAPIFPRNATAMFVFEPVNKAVVRAKVPGYVEKVYVSEGEAVNAGSPLVSMRNVDLEGEAASAKQEAAVAQADRTRAQVVYASLGSAQSEVQRTERIQKTVEEQLRELEPRSPIAGVVVTPRVGDLQGRYVAEGTLLMEIEEPDKLRARVYLPEFEVKDVQVGQLVTLHPKSLWASIPARVDTLAVAPSKLEEGLLATNNYKGLQPPSFYEADALVNSQGGLRPGMTGEAKILISHESLGRKIWRSARDAVSRKLW